MAGYNHSMSMNRKELAAYLDHSLLDVRATAEEVADLCDVALREQVAAVCVSPNRVAFTHNILKDTNISVASVCGFPSGLHKVAVKTKEIELALLEGADEIDVVVNLANVFDQKWDLVSRELKEIRLASENKIVKLILEVAVLNEKQIVSLCRCAVDEGIDIVKTSTGMHAAGGATVDSVKLMAETVTGEAGVKAAGGIRTTEVALAMIAAGATRIGCSATLTILDGLEEKSGS